MEVLKRRRHPRRNLTRGVGVLCAGRYSVGQAHEISEGGMMFRVAPGAEGEPLKAGQSVVLSFQIPNRDFVTLTAEILYKVKDQSYGVKFLNISFERRRMIRDYISNKSIEEAKQETSHV